MSKTKELPKIVEKTESEINEIIIQINSSSLSPSDKEFIISCIELSIWLPNAFIEKKISISNLKKLIFGQGKKKRLIGRQQ